MAHHRDVLNLIYDHGLDQIQDQETRKDHVLDLYLTNNTSLVKTTNMIPGLSDHNIVIGNIKEETYLHQKSNKEVLFEKRNQTLTQKKKSTVTQKRQKFVFIMQFGFRSVIGACF